MLLSSLSSFFLLSFSLHYWHKSATNIHLNVCAWSSSQRPTIKLDLLHTMTKLINNIQQGITSKRASERERERNRLLIKREKHARIEVNKEFKQMYRNIRSGLFIRLNRDACLIDQISIFMSWIRNRFLCLSTDCDILHGHYEGYCYEQFESTKHGLSSSRESLIVNWFIMATTTTTENNSNQMERLTTCPVCLDKFRTPKLLPCMHTFCLTPCLTNLVDPRARSLRCPECRREHLIPAG